MAFDLNCRFCYLLSDVWVCSSTCRQVQTKNKDGVLEYSQCLLWRGLNHLARRDALREGDRPMIIAHWKMDMLTFMQDRHPKYLILAHHLVAG